MAERARYDHQPASSTVRPSVPTQRPQRDRISDIPDGPLTPELIDSMLEKTRNTTLQSATPNYHLSRVVTNEVIKSKDDFIADVTEVCLDDDLSPDEYMDRLNELWKTHFPVTNDVLDTAMTHPEIFIVRNDLASSTVGPYDTNAFSQSSVFPVNEFGKPSVDVRGAQFDPSVIRVPIRDLEKVGDRYIPVRRYDHTIHSVKQRHWACRPIPPKILRPDKHQHPLKYALRRFAATCVKQVMHDGMDPNIQWFVGNIVEAVDVMRTCNVAINCIDGTIPAKVAGDYRFKKDLQVWNTRAKVVDVNNPTFDPKPVGLITGYREYVHLAKASQTEWYQYIYPVADWLHLLKDNANRAMRFESPKVDGSTITMSLYDANRGVAKYKLDITPLGYDYATLPFNSWYQHHPAFNDTKAGRTCHYANDAQALFFLKIKFVNCHRYHLLPKAKLGPSNCEHLEVRPLPAPQPLFDEWDYEGYDGAPVLVYLNTGQTVVTVRVVDYVTRVVHNFIERDLPLSAAAKAIFLGFVKEGVVHIALVLWSSLMFDGLVSDWQVSALDYFGFFSYNPNGCARNKSGYELAKIFSRDKKHSTWYIPHRHTRYIASITSYDCKVLATGHEYNVDFCIPLTHAGITGKLNYLMDMPNRADDYHTYEGVTHAL